MTLTNRNTAEFAEDIANRLLVKHAEAEAVWAATDAAARRDLLTRCGDAVTACAEEWVEVAATLKGLPTNSPLLGEEWITGPWATLGGARALAATLDRISRGADPLGGTRLRRAPGGRVAVPALPASHYDSLLLSGFTADVWMQPGLTEHDVLKSAGLGSLEPARTRGTALVLGAGNVLSIAPLDVLYVLHADNRAVILKVNPVTDTLVPVYEKVLAPYIELGVVQVVSGGAELGSALAHDDRVSAVHMTGSEKPHDAVAWGVGDDAVVARAAGTPRLTKPMTSELGGVSPIIVMPERWSKRDLRFQAEHVATQRLHNAGANCVAGQVVIVSSDWDQKDAFLAELERVFADATDRPTWYSGGEQRMQEARDSHPGLCADLGPARRVLIRGVDLTAEDPAFTTEYFAPVLVITELAGEGLDFMAAAIAAANAHLRGTLGANVIIDPRTRRRLGAGFEKALADLRYGTIAVNAWTGVGYLTPHATWGAFPGHTLADAQSGIGVVHNAFLLDGAERTVVRGPFRPSPRSLLRGEFALAPRPPWFVTNRTAATTGRRLVSFADRPRISALPGIFASALRG